MQAEGREGKTPHGREIFKAAATPLAEALTSTLAENLEGPSAGVGFAALALVGRFSHPNVAAIVALKVVLDRISASRPYVGLCLAIGRAMEDELRAESLSRANPALTASIKRAFPGRSALLRDRVVRLVAPGDDHEPWSAQTQAQAGALMVHLMERVGLVTTELAATGGKRPRVVVPTEETIRLAEEVADRPWASPRGPMLVSPISWQGLSGGGHLAGGELVRERAPSGDRNRFTDEAVARFARIANIQQGVPLWVDPAMVQLMQRAWDHGGLGLFKVDREPREIPPRPPRDAGEAVWSAWARQAAAHHADLRRNVGRRSRIARGLRELGEVAGRTIYQPAWFDGRGRLYTSNRAASTQGQDCEKAAISFEGSDEALASLAWLDRGAAVHAGKGWGDPGLAAAGEWDDPLNMLEAWRLAKEPWQFLQAARAAAELRRGGVAPVVPIRFDQTCSGCGIVAALTRDRWLAAQTNVTGDGHKDLYSTMAQLLTEEVESRLHSLRAGGRRYRYAEMFLGLGIDRSMVKNPVLAIPYGGQRVGVAQAFEDWTLERLGWQDPASYAEKIAMPCQWLANIFSEVAAKRLGSAMAFRRWAREVVHAIVPLTEQSIRWSSPSGWPMRLGGLMTTETIVRTEFFGSARLMTLQEDDPRGRMSAIATARSAAANIVHGIDASVVHQLVFAAAEAKVDLLTNHDCFAVAPKNADWLLPQLLQTFAQVAEGAAEGLVTGLEDHCRAAGLAPAVVPRFPFAGPPWQPGEIGANAAMYG